MVDDGFGVAVVGVAVDGGGMVIGIGVWRDQRKGIVAEIIGVGVTLIFPLRVSAVGVRRGKAALFQWVKVSPG